MWPFSKKKKPGAKADDAAAGETPKFIQSMKPGLDAEMLVTSATVGVATLVVVSSGSSLDSVLDPVIDVLPDPGNLMDSVSALLESLGVTRGSEHHSDAIQNAQSIVQAAGEASALAQNIPGSLQEGAARMEAAAKQANMVLARYLETSGPLPATEIESLDGGKMRTEAIAAAEEVASYFRRCGASSSEGLAQLERAHRVAVTFDYPDAAKLAHDIFPEKDPIRRVTFDALTDVERQAKARRIVASLIALKAVQHAMVRYLPATRRASA